MRYDFKNSNQNVRNAYKIMHLIKVVEINFMFTCYTV